MDDMRRPQKILGRQASVTGQPEARRLGEFAVYISSASRNSTAGPRKRSAPSRGHYTAMRLTAPSRSDRSAMPADGDTRRVLILRVAKGGCHETPSHFSPSDHQRVRSSDFG